MGIYYATVTFEVPFIEASNLEEADRKIDQMLDEMCEPNLSLRWDCVDWQVREGE